MLYIHPVFQLCMILLALYALRLGWLRFQSLHLGKKTAFPRPRHILVGKIALGGLLVGMAGGAYLAKAAWHANFVTGAHAWIAAFLLPLLAWGLITGLYLEHAPGRRKVLPLLHGLGNAIVAGLGLAQIATGIHVLNQWVWSGL
jgi:hypothetical protein